ncbi:MAG: NAD(P)/FAD-dependent oxidoreductase [Rhizomicrobium sp.]|jgi:flavin-dependent dehydrogenase
MPAKFDLVIVGGSFAGLACARTAALRGLKVAVLDGKSDPGARVRTTGILVKEATEDCDLPADLMRKVRGVKLYAPDGRTLDLHAPGYYFQATDTAALLRWMAAEAERAGAKLIYGERFGGAREDRSGLTLPTLGLHTQFLIGADGARSQVAQFFGLGRNRRFLAGVEVECEPLGGLDSRFLHCFADSRIAAGYIGWAVPGQGVTQIGVASVRGRKPQLSELLSRVAKISGGDALRVVERRSGLIPTGGPVEPPGRGRVMLIGDAAGLVSPVTGGGIHTALHFGRRAAQLVGEYLYDRGSHPLAAFAREIPRYRLKRVLRRVLDLVPPNALIDAMLMTAPLRALAQRLYFHRRSGDPASFETWQDDFARGNMDPQPPSRTQELRCM